MRVISILAWIVAALIVIIILILLLPVILFWVIVGLVMFVISLAAGFFSLFRSRRRREKQFELPKSRVKIKDL